jgi:hypothetical protein
MAFVGGSVVCLCGLQEQQAPPGWIPGHVVSVDPLWNTLYGARVTYDEARGLLVASFSEVIRRMNGEQATISGFVLPFESSRRFRHFALTRRNSSCPFCTPNEPTEAVEVFAATPIEYTPDEYRATGRFEIVAESGEGLFYRLHDARVRANR